MPGWLTILLRDFADDGLTLLVGIFLGGFWQSRLTRRTAAEIRRQEREEVALLELIAAVWDADLLAAALTSGAREDHPDLVMPARSLTGHLVNLERRWHSALAARIQHKSVAKLAKGIWDSNGRCLGHVSGARWGALLKEVETMRVLTTILRTEAEHLARGKRFLRTDKPWRRTDEGD